MPINNSLDPASAPLAVGKGGTGNQSFSINSLIIGGSSSISPLQIVNSSSTGFPLVYQDFLMPPVFYGGIVSGFRDVIVDQLAGSFTFSPYSNTTYIIIEMVGGGGGAGGTSNVCVSGAGGSGGYVKFLVTGTANINNIAGSVGAGGAGGLAGNFPGGNGSPTTVTVNGGTSTVAGFGFGGGGQSNASATASGSAGYSSACSFGTNIIPIIAIQGQPGGFGYADTSNSIFVSGTGGKSFFGNGGPSSTIVGVSSTVITGSATSFGDGCSATISTITGDSVGNAGNNGTIFITSFIQ